METKRGPITELTEVDSAECRESLIRDALNESIFVANGMAKISALMLAGEPINRDLVHDVGVNATSLAVSVTGLCSMLDKPALDKIVAESKPGEAVTFSEYLRQAREYNRETSISAVADGVTLQAGVMCSFCGGHTATCGC